MGRPTCITSDVAALIDGAIAPGRSAELVHRRVNEQGASVSLSSLKRYLKRRAGQAATVPAHMAPFEGSPAKQAERALETDDLTELRAAKAAVSDALRGWSGSLGFDPRGVRAYTSLVGLLKSVTQAIQELTPATPEDRYAPVEGSALEELRARAEASARLDDDLRGRLRRAQDLIERLVDEGH